MSEFNLFTIPEITEINRLPMHGAGKPVQSPENCETASTISLDGKWKFALYHTPEEVDSESFSADFDDRKWRTIEVPANWTMQNTFDKPIYTNINMPFKNNPPFVPEENPTGIYRTNFNLPKSWSGRRVVIHIGGAESYLEVYLNGSFVGMGKDTRLPSEFDLTPYILPGKNVLVCKVIRWSDSSYVEDQDQWWMAGIYRSVYLYSTGNVWLEDIWANGDWKENSKQGILSVQAKIGFLISHWAKTGGPVANYFVSCTLLDNDNSAVAVVKSEVDCHFRISGYRTELNATISDIQPWSAETPVLYTLVTALYDADGSLIDCRKHRVGFRNIRIEGSNLLINGKRVMIYGVNRHEHDPETGKTISLEKMVQDIKLLKQFNFNAVRTCHYPCNHIWYDLCDEYGIYLVDEANFESHANYATLCRDPRWKKSIVSRVERMILRDRSHASIISWSLGNESGNGENHTEAAEIAKKLDPTRPLFHEGELKDSWQQRLNRHVGGSNEINSFYNPMYPPISDLKAFSANPLSTRPCILSEYAHAMGNSSGSLSDYWNLFFSSKSMQGGFIWDWVDQGILQYDENGKPFYAYGGDFGEKIHDFNFCCNGMLGSNREPHPAMFEFRHLVQPVKIHMGDTPFSFKLQNRRFFTALDDLVGNWSVEINGEVAQSGIISSFANTKPGETVEFSIPLKKLERPQGSEVFINFSFNLAKANTWGEAGTLLAHDQINLTEIIPIENKKEGKKFEVSRSLGKIKNLWHLQCGNMELVIAENGSVKELRKDGKPVMCEAFNCNLFRAGTDNDGIRGWSGQENKPLAKWLVAGLDKIKPKLLNITADEENFTLFCEYACTGSIDTLHFNQKITAHSDGSLEFSQEYHIPDSFPTMPRIGVIGLTATGFEEFQYFGCGPWENYIDRCSSAQVGLYNSTVRENFISTYAIPQENGNRTGVRSLTLKSPDCQIRIVSTAPFEFGASHYTPQDLFSAKHPNELEERVETVVTLDLIQRGLGTGSCGPQTLPEYEINGKFYKFTFSVI